MDATSLPSLPSLKIRIDLDTEDRIGPGKIRLLEVINACGSISAAGRTMNMSYKHAWDFVGEITRICNHDVIVRRVGGDKGGGAKLTPFGLALVARYRKIERSIINATRKELLALKADIQKH
jgi:molybdate transport system regulatory protein